MSAKVLVTGASGFLAAHIIQQLYAKGYTVIGTVRSDAKGEFLVKQYPEFKYEIVKDVSVDDAFDHVFQAHPDVDYVLHTASPFHFNGTDPEKDLVIPAVNGTLSALKAAKKYGANVKKVVVTSSFAAMVQIPVIRDSSFVYTEKTWSNLTRETSVANAYLGYFGSKALAEKAAWEFLETEKPNFAITTIQIPYVWGPTINDIGVETMNTSNGIILDLITPREGDRDWDMDCYWIDVRDAAATHLIGMTESGLDNKRCFSVAGVANLQSVADTLSATRPDLDAVLAKGTPGTFDATKYAAVDNSESQKYLKMTYIPLAKTLSDTVDRILELKKAAAASASA